MMAVPDGRGPASRPGQPRRETLVGSARALGILVIACSAMVVALVVWILAIGPFSGSSRTAMLILPLGLLPMVIAQSVMWRIAVRRLRAFDEGARSPGR